jgi:predicted DCC family thiol-disulfide oxidoreductase YuxK
MNENRNSIPTLLFDGNCGFCRRWVRKWHCVTGERVRFLPYQEAISQYPQVTAQQCAEAVQLILPEGTVFAGAHAVFKALELSGRYRSLLRMYEKLPLCATLAEWLYQLVARNRMLFSKFA